MLPLPTQLLLATQRMNLPETSQPSAVINVSNSLLNEPQLTTVCDNSASSIYQNWLFNATMKHNLMSCLGNDGA